ncbi:DUF3613 domain-containing protein [Pseudomonas guariconensis]|uniref:DUF3613 domain-containing protein n=1 Tax=Pseudomonas TaxID=286 RepID=UPI002096B7C5|nr:MULTISPECIES: DUF3613 domain-containing protein [Pseudomonas]MCO7639271.1 DUF3613 domain-containing protein [Pseudomonas sp. S 311-6]MCO7516123.1 DUF3613 domain-containing protein [Pseudomonas putida]MCO7565358.1 DUF3613 domain-containing protein [Pseudomonas mosselii]MCO7594524.1 DUF3613 domain-containing protein [Pseudomonas guariconensis]MCO7607571.1 DUF3613 domain-containing protein [Pseudomonas guariconensis]
MLKCVILLVGLAGPLAALAEEPAQTATEALLQVQASNQQASPTPQVQTAREREQALQRWLDSYKYPIPEVFRWQSVGSSGD